MFLVIFVGTEELDGGRRGFQCAAGKSQGRRCCREGARSVLENVVKRRLVEIRSCFGVLCWWGVMGSLAGFPLQPTVGDPASAGGWTR